MNANIYKFNHYRPAFTALFQAERDKRPGWSTALLAERIAVQPSHLTNVIKERSHFSSDQIYAIAAALALSDEETVYLDLLMEWERAEVPARKAKLLKSVQQTRNEKLRVRNVLKATPADLSAELSESYYLDPNVELLHVYLSTNDALNDTTELATLWGFSPNYVADLLLILEKARLIERRAQRWIVKPIHQLLPATSPLCKPQQMLKRMRAMEVLQKLQADRIYSFSGTLTMSEDTRLSIQVRFVEFLKDIENLVLESPADGIYHLQFDLFPWLEPKKTKRY